MLQRGVLVALSINHFEKSCAPGSNFETAHDFAPLLGYRHRGRLVAVNLILFCISFVCSRALVMMAENFEEDHAACDVRSAPTTRLCPADRSMNASLCMLEHPLMPLKSLMMCGPRTPRDGAPPAVL